MKATQWAVCLLSVTLMSSLALSSFARQKTYNLSRPRTTQAVIKPTTTTTQPITTSKPLAQQVNPQNYPWAAPPAGIAPQPVQPIQSTAPLSSNYLQQQQQALTDAKNTRNILLILDASDSMNEPMEGSTKFTLAKQVLIDTLRKIPLEVRVGLRVYGHRAIQSHGIFGLGGVDESATCKVSDLVVPIMGNNRDAIANTIQSLNAVGLTPITFSLQRAQADFNGVEGSKMIILISDGRETCSNVDPCDYSLSQVRSGSTIKINTIGFNLQDPVAEDQLKCVALSTKGRYFSADTAGELVDSLEKSLQAKTEVRARIVE